jgi:hypothetical protein
MVVQRLPVWFHEVRSRGGACLFGDGDRRRVFSFCLAVLVLVSVRAVRGGCTGASTRGGDGGNEMKLLRQLVVCCV